MVAAPTATNPQCGSLRRGFHCAGLRLQDESKSDKPPSSTTYHEHYQARSAEQDTAASASDPAADQSTDPNTRSVIVTLVTSVIQRGFYKMLSDVGELHLVSRCRLSP